MARLVVDGEDIVVRLSWREKAATRCRDVRIPLTAVKDVRVEPDWWRALRGGRRRGRYSPGRFCVGEWQHRDGRDFVALNASDPVVCVDLRRSAPFARLAVSVTDPDEITRTIRTRRSVGPSGI
ncbi:hypothetical protein [Streptomyces albicerus]|uniref:hypothetical protein n=1 Tax=Streptomyces albicerus TaxID=2569859 RepID=UPI00124AFC26|nr:hypothetical protein [Streptomyces albicerus]